MAVQLNNPQPPRRSSIPGAVLGAAVVLLLVLVIFWPRGAADLPPPLGVDRGAARDWNVLVLTLDTTRADRLGCYGYPRAATPNIDRLARQGVRFADAVTTVPMTLPAHCSIFTGLYPPHAGVRDNGAYKLAAEHETLAERFRAAGYSTAAFVSAFVLDARYGLDQGFDVYDDEITINRGDDRRQFRPQRPADAVVRSATRWLEQHGAAGDRPFFLWVHLFDPHTPYAPPEPFRSQFGHSLYDGEIAFMDREIGRLLAALESRGLTERTLVAVVGDHGEGLGDHGEATHRLFIYDSVMHVPFILHAPGILPPGTVVADRAVSVVDLPNTLLDLAGLERFAGDGLSLVTQTAPVDRALYMETLAPRLAHGWSELYGLRTHDAKFIEAPHQEFYDLTTDPGERRNLRATNPGAGEWLKDRLWSLIEGFPEDAGTEAEIDSAARAQLDALGCVGSGSVTTGDGPRPDPKDMIARWQAAMSAASTLIDTGRFAEAVALIAPLVENELPHDADLWSMLATAQHELGRNEAALESRLRSIELQPDDANRWLHLAQLQLERGDLEGVEVSLSEAERLEPDHGEIYLFRARLAIQQEDYERALALCEEARTRDPSRHRANGWALAANVHLRLGDDAAWREALEQALEADPAHAGAALALAQAALRDGDMQRVADLCRRVRRGESEWPASRTLLARSLVALGEGDAAVDAMKELISAAPRAPAAHANLGSVYFSLGRLEDAAESFADAIELDGDYALAHVNLGNVRLEQGGYDAALEHFDRALDLAPDLAEAALGRLRAEVRAGRAPDLGRLRALLERGTLLREMLADDPELAPLLERLDGSGAADNGGSRRGGDGDESP